MFFPFAILIAATVLSAPQNLEDEELALAEKTIVMEQDEATEDGELIFDDSEQVAELVDDN